LSTARQIASSTLHQQGAAPSIEHVEHGNDTDPTEQTEHPVIRHHLKHMAIGAAAVLALLLAFGVDLAAALRWAALLACLLGMAAMMLVMGRGHGHGPGAPTPGTNERAQHGADGSATATGDGMALSGGK